MWRFYGIELYAYGENLTDDMTKKKTLVQMFFYV